MDNGLSKKDLHVLLHINEQRLLTYRWKYR
jgi:hypothetical protein